MDAMQPDGSKPVGANNKLLVFNDVKKYAKMYIVA